MRWMVFGLLFSLICAFVGIAGTITVPDDYPTIQAAIDAAQSGDTVYVKSGIYEEQIHVEKPLKLQGEDRVKVTIRAPNHEKEAVKITLDVGKVVIENLTIKEGESGIKGEIGDGAQVIVENVSIIENKYGVLITGDGEFSLNKSYLIDNSIALILFLLGRADIHNNEFLRDGLGILLGGYVEARIVENLLGLCRSGIFIWSTGCGFKRNYFWGKITGKGNKIYTLNQNLCPSYPSSPWPVEFVDEEWIKVINKAIAEYNRGLDAYNAQDYRTAVSAYNAALIWLKEKEFPLLKAYLYRNLGNAYLKLERFGESLNCYSEALSILSERGMETDFHNIITQCESIWICAPGREPLLGPISANVLGTNPSLARYSMGDRYPSREWRRPWLWYLICLPIAHSSSPSVAASPNNEPFSTLNRPQNDSIHGLSFAPRSQKDTTALSSIKSCLSQR